MGTDTWVGLIFILCNSNRRKEPRFTSVPSSFLLFKPTKKKMNLLFVIATFTTVYVQSTACGTSEHGTVGIHCDNKPHCNNEYRIRFNRKYNGSLPEVHLETIGTFNFEDRLQNLHVGLGMPPDLCQVAAMDVSYGGFTLISNVTWNSFSTWPTTFVQWTASA